MKQLSTTGKRILDAAIELFAKQGFNAVSIRNIAAEAGLQASSVYNHFSGKEEILHCIFDLFLEGLRMQRVDEREMAYEIEFMPPREVFRLLFIRYVKNRTPEIDNMARIIHIERITNERARTFVKQNMILEPAEVYEDILQRMAARGKIKPGVDLRVVAEELNYGFLGITFNMMSEENEEDSTDSLNKLSRHVNFVFEHIEA